MPNNEKQTAGQPQVGTSDLVGPLTEDQFIDGYCARSGVSREWLMGAEGMRAAMRCECSAEECEGWAMVRNDPLSIQTHLELYGPRPNAAGETPRH